MSTQRITVHIESEPHTEDLSTTLLNRPAPNGGAFLIDERIERGIWDQMKAAGAWYLNRDHLEDNDMFDAEPGWRYSIDAVAVLLRNGYSLDLRGEIVTTEAELRAMFTAEAKEAARVRRLQEYDRYQQQQRDLAEQQRLEREERGRDYAAWQQQHLVGLVYTVAEPTVGGYGDHWRPVKTFPAGTPGAWYDTGDRWFQTTIDGATVYRCDYGSAVRYYGPQELVDQWILAKDDGSVRYARHVLEYYGYGVYGSDIANRLIVLNGLDHYLQRAVTEEWIIVPSQGRKNDVIAHYQLPVTPIRCLSYAEVDGYPVRAVLGMAQRDGYPAPYSGLGQTGDGRWFATTSYTGGAWRGLTADECAALGLSMEPPAMPPAMPPADPLPSAEETAERSQRFSSLFS